MELNYEAAYLARVDEKTEPVVSSELRTATDTAFLRLSYYLNAGASAVANTGEERLQVSLCSRVIDAINVVIQDIKYRAYRDTSNNDNDDDNDNDNDGDNPQSSIVNPPSLEEDDLSQE